MYVACTKEMNDWFWCYGYQSYHYCMSCYRTNAIKNNNNKINGFQLTQVNLSLILLYICNTYTVTVLMWHSCSLVHQPCSGWCSRNQLFAGLPWHLVQILILPVITINYQFVAFPVKRSFISPPQRPKLSASHSWISTIGFQGHACL